LKSGNPEFFVASVLFFNPYKGWAEASALITVGDSISQENSCAGVIDWKSSNRVGSLAGCRIGPAISGSVFGESQ
jgi:hypothetical protein